MGSFRASNDVARVIKETERLILESEKTLADLNDKQLALIEILHTLTGYTEGSDDNP